MVWKRNRKVNVEETVGLKGEDYQAPDQGEFGGVTEDNVVDAEARILLGEILSELRIMNSHLQSITDEDIRDGDLSCK